MTIQLKALPAQYAKAIAAAIGQAIIYLQLYGPSWHLVPALTAAGVVLGVAGVPNAPKPSPVSPVSPVSPSNVTVKP